MKLSILYDEVNARKNESRNTYELGVINPGFLRGRNLTPLQFLRWSIAGYRSAEFLALIRESRAIVRLSAGKLVRTFIDKGMFLGFMKFCTMTQGP